MYTVDINILLKEESVINKHISEYQNYVNKTGNRLNLYRLIANEFNIKVALYPGSHIDLDPSLVIPKVTYIDNFKGAIKFFKNIDEINLFLENNKEYFSRCEFNFIGEDYSKTLDIDKVDLIISQYAGFVGQATKRYLRSNGILLCNDSHGDATLAKFDSDFKFIGVIENNRIKSTKLDEYFKLPKGKKINLDIVRTKMKGFKYIKRAENYIFRKI